MKMRLLISLALVDMDQLVKMEQFPKYQLITGCRTAEFSDIPDIPFSYF